MRKYNVKKNFSRASLLLLFLLFLSWVLTAVLTQHAGIKSSSYNDLKQAKIMVNEALSYMEDNFSSIEDNSDNLKLTSILKTNGIDTALLDLDGRVLFSSANSTVKALREPVNIKYINIAESETFNFIAPVVVDNRIMGNCVFSIQRSLLTDGQDNIPILLFLPLITGTVVSLIIIIRAFKNTKKYLLDPIRQLNAFTSSIARGNFNNRLSINADSEITELLSSLQLMQEELRHSLERQMSIERERKELIACISHDLRTPLSSIKAYAGAIKDGFAKDTTDLINFSAIIESKADSISRLIEDFFEHSKADLGQLRINKKPLYTKEIILRSYETYKFEFLNGGVNFLLDTDIPDVLVDADPLRLEQVLFNLLQNAKKYTPAGGTVSLGACIEGPFLKCYVRDTGIGISSFDLPHIFEKFFRGSKSSSDEYRDGTGLGLAICRYIVGAHGGQIYAESKLNVGSTFCFTIPKS